MNGRFTSFGSKMHPELDFFFQEVKQELGANLRKHKEKYNYDFEQDIPIENSKLVWDIESPCNHNFKRLALDISN